MQEFWACPHCHSMNIASNGNCYKCHSTRPVGVELLAAPERRRGVAQRPTDRQRVLRLPAVVLGLVVAVSGTAFVVSGGGQGTPLAGMLGKASGPSASSFAPAAANPCRVAVTSLATFTKGIAADLASLRPLVAAAKFDSTETGGAIRRISARLTASIGLEQDLRVCSATTELAPRVEVLRSSAQVAIDQSQSASTMGAQAQRDAGAGLFGLLPEVRQLSEAVGAIADDLGIIFAAKPPTGDVPATKQAAAFINDFEFAADAPGVRTTDNQAMFDVTRVASGTDGIKASSGGWYAQAAHNDWVTGTLQPFTRYGGYSHTFGDGYTTSVDIYLDMTKAVGGNRHFDWSSAPFNNAPGSDGFGRDFIFSVGEKSSAPGSFIVSVGNDAPGVPANGADPLSITRSGWYTFKHEFKSNLGVLSVDMKVIDAKGTVLKIWTLSDPGDVIGPMGIGGNRYGWLIDNDFDMLALDNITRVQK